MALRQTGRRFFTTTEVARYCAVSSDAVIKWVKAGKLRGFTTPGGHYRISEEDFRGFLERFDMPVDEGFFAGVGPPRRVLVVDDDANFRELVRRTLERAIPEVEVEEARDAYDAGIKVGDLRPDLVVLDVMMPGLDGVSLCRSIRANPATRDVAILALSGLLTPELSERLYAAGADALMDKPLRAHEFRQEVRRLLGRGGRPGRVQPSAG